MNYDQKGRIIMLLIAFFILLAVISSVISAVKNRSNSFLGIGSGNTVSTFKWWAFGIIMLIFVAAIAYFVFFIGGKKYTRY